MEGISCQCLSTMYIFDLWMNRFLFLFHIRCVDFTEYPVGKLVNYCLSIIHIFLAPPPPKNVQGGKKNVAFKMKIGVLIGLRAASTNSVNSFLF